VHSAILTVVGTHPYPSLGKRGTYLKLIFRLQIPVRIFVGKTSLTIIPSLPKRRVWEEFDFL